MLSRREFLQKSGVLGGALAFQAGLPAWARIGRAHSMQGLQVLSGDMFDLSVSQVEKKIDGKFGNAVLINKQLPAPLLRWREGAEVVLRVSNHLSEDTSIHWHGILLPYQMDGVPGVSFSGIHPGETFVYQFPIKQSGTYWYHSHSGFQEQLGHYGPIIIDPVDEYVEYDREYVIVLSDWAFESPQRIFSNLKKMADVYNFQQNTLVDFFHDVKQQGLNTALAQRMMWGSMRMNRTDIADVTGAVYTYLLNGHSPSENWTGIFNAGERVRLRFINASAMSIFNVRIPEVPMVVVQADGLAVKPVEVDEFQIGTAETYDVIVRPDNQAYTIMCESNDRSGYARGTLTPQLGLVASVPKLRSRPTLTMKDMAMEGHHHNHHGHDMAGHEHRRGPGVVGLAMNPTNRLSEPPIGLQNVAHRVLRYSNLRSLEQNPDIRSPSRTLELHLTSNMERYMWSFDGVKFSEIKKSIVFDHGERLRLVLVNDTMMSHPIHLHGMFFDVVTHEDHYKPRKHTIVVKPGEKLSVDISADAVGEWAFHCHLLYHMLAGMMRIISVRDQDETI